ncbi:hypothetical protein D3C76_805410 [compost metagenome]
MLAKAVVQTTLIGKKLPNILERLELQGIAAGIEQKHRRLFAHQPLESYPRLNHETSPLRLQPFGQRLLLRHSQYLQVYMIPIKKPA